MQGARAIFRIHLPTTVPVSPNGSRASATYGEIIESAVSAGWDSPNAGNDIATIRYRDGKLRIVLALDLVGG